VVVTVSRGWTHVRDTATYLEHLDRTVVKELGADRANRGVVVLWRPDGERTEFVLMSWSEGGEDAEAVTHEPSAFAADDGYLVEREEEARRYDVLVRGDLALAGFWAAL
jgi:hypothetical protein